MKNYHDIVLSENAFEHGASLSGLNIRQHENQWTCAVKFPQDSQIHPDSICIFNTFLPLPFENSSLFSHWKKLSVIVKVVLCDRQYSIYLFFVFILLS